MTPQMIAQVLMQRPELLQEIGDMVRGPKSWFQRGEVPGVPVTGPMPGGGGGARIMTSKQFWPETMNRNDILGAIKNKVPADRRVYPNHARPEQPQQLTDREKFDAAVREQQGVVRPGEVRAHQRGYSPATVDRYNRRFQGRFPEGDKALSDLLSGKFANPSARDSAQTSFPQLPPKPPNAQHLTDEAWAKWLLSQGWRPGDGF